MLRSTTAVLALALVAITGPAAFARSSATSTVTQFCGVRVCPTFARVERLRHHARAFKRDTRKREARRHPAESPKVEAVEKQTVAEPHGLTVINGCAGLHVRVAAEYADRFQGFMCALVAAGHKITRAGTACQAFGHMPGSKHDWGGACDIMQRARNRAAAFMYHVTELAHRFGLKDGCEWRRRPDCGHVEVPGSNREARARHYRRYASRDRREPGT